MPTREFWLLLRIHSDAFRSAVHDRSRPGAEAGVSTLEMVIITLGLIAVATLLVAAVTAAVTRRTNQIQ